MYTRRSWFKVTLPLGATLFLAKQLSAASTGPPEIRVFKRHFSRCCDGWMTHLRENGFRVIEEPVSNLAAIKADYEIPKDLITCHTAVVSGYIVEGHVPADCIHRLLQERTIVAGIAVAGLPVGAPGSPTEGQKQPYDVVLFDKAGKKTLFDRR
jgi:hypothetical protein